MMEGAFSGATWATGVGSVPVEPGKYPDNNPKTAQGVKKVPLHLVPPSASHHLALAFKDGAAKYGPYNWRDHKVSASVYVAAAKRHIDAWWDGENLSPDAGVEHLAHAMACMAIILDAASVDKLNDDRPTAGASPQLQADYAAGRALDSVSMAPPIVPHGVAAAALRDGVFAPSLAVAAGEPATGGGSSSQAVLADEYVMPEEPPLRACAAGGCGDE